MKTHPDGVCFHVDGQAITGREGEPLIDCLNRHDIYLPHLCYHPGLGPLKTCDTCLVTDSGRLTHGCGLSLQAGMDIRLLGGQPERAR